MTQLLAAGRDGLQRVGGEVLTEYYLDSLAEEIDTALRGVGRLTLAEVAVAHALSTDFVTSVGHLPRARCNLGPSRLISAELG